MRKNRTEVNLITTKQQRFADEYLLDCNGTQAAIRAGYSPNTANEQGARLLAKPNIKAYIDQQLQALQSQNVADAQEVAEYLTAVLRGESKAHVLMGIGGGDQMVTTKPPDEKERIKAAELLGKRYGMFKDTVNLTAAVPVVITDDMVDDDDAP